jgi:hypothetical protein
MVIMLISIGKQPYGHYMFSRIGKRGRLLCRSGHSK